MISILHKVFFLFWPVVLSLLVSLFPSNAFCQTPTIDSLKSVLDTISGKEDQAATLNLLAARVMGMDAQTGFDYAQRALELSQQTDLKGEMATAYNYMGSSSVYLTKYDEAKEYFTKSIETFESIGDEKGMADITGNLGHIHHMLGEFSKALELQLKALELFEKIENQEGINNTNMAIGTIYMENDDFAKALYYDSLALLGYKREGDSSGVAITYGNMANVYMEMNDVEKAGINYDRAIKLHRNSNNLYDMGRELSNQSTMMEKTGNYAGAIEAAQEAADIFQMIGYGTGYCYARGNVGAFYLSSFQKLSDQDTSLIFPEGDSDFYLDQAVLNMKEAVDLAIQNQDQKVLSQVSETLSTALDAQGNEVEAYKYYKIYREIEDSIRSIELKEQIEQLTTERELAVKDKQIELDRLAVQKKRNERVYFIGGLILLALTLILIYRNYINQKKSNVQLGAKNTELNQTLHQLKETQDQLIESERLKEQAELRTKISQDIHDDISSGLTKISWLTETLKSRQRASGMSDLEPLIDKITKSSRSTVSKLGEIIWSTNPGRDNLESLLNYIKEQVTSFLDGSKLVPGFDFPHSLPHHSINPELRRNLYLVCKEAVNNAFKYSEGTVIEVGFQLKEDGYVLTIKDNGKGMTEGVIEGTGNGLGNMKTRMQSVGGQLNIASTPYQGTTLTCTGPLY